MEDEQAMICCDEPHCCPSASFAGWNHSDECDDAGTHDACAVCCDDEDCFDDYPLLSAGTSKGRSQEGIGECCFEFGDNSREGFGDAIAKGIVCCDACCEDNGTVGRAAGKCINCAECAIAQEEHEEQQGSSYSGGSSITEREEGEQLADVDERQGRICATAATTPEHATANLAGVGELMAGLDDEAIRAIMECCCCGPEPRLDHINFTQHALSHHAHSANDSSSSQQLQHQYHHQPKISSLPPHAQSAAQDPAYLASEAIASAADSALAFQCLWRECFHSTETKLDLTAHLVQNHLHEPMITDSLFSSGMSAKNHASELAVDQGELRCMWDDCSQLGFDNLANAGASTTMMEPSSRSLDQLPTFTNHAPSITPSTADNTLPSQPQSRDHNQLSSTQLYQHLVHHHLDPLEPRHTLNTTGASSSVGAASSLSATSSSKPLPQPHSHPHSHPHHSHSHSYHSHLHPHTSSHAHSHAHPYHSHSHSSVGPRGKSTASSSPPICRWQSCNLEFATTALLMEHLASKHVGRGKTKYECLWDGCERLRRASSAAAAAAAAVVAVEGGDEEEAGVAENDGAFLQRQKIIRHLQMHTGDRPYSCDVYGKAFSEQTTLTQHKRIHTQERPFVCTFEGCKKAFAIASALTIHVRTHTGDKPFKCPEPGCNKSFCESSNLSKHVRVHRGMKDRACEVCGKMFQRSDQLARHRKIHEREAAAAAAAEMLQMEQGK